MPYFLNIGCGPKRKAQTTAGFNTDAWQEIHLDIDATVPSDVTGSMIDMAAVPNASVNAIFSSHNIQYLYPHEVPLAFAEFLRVLTDDGFAVITCPDLQSVAELIAEDKLTEPAYNSSAGPIAPIDILFGYRSSMAEGNLFMAHHCGYTAKALSENLQAAGFKTLATMARASEFDLWVVASKSPRTEAEIRHLAKLHFPT